MSIGRIRSPILSEGGAGLAVFLELIAVVAILLDALRSVKLRRKSNEPVPIEVLLYVKLDDEAV
ncbi:MAG: hypothetical protein JNJ39_12410 [Blastocatellia bacterium]|nr:hypothetical protein [Blastocatellia bacterium]